MTSCSETMRRTRGHKRHPTDITLVLVTAVLGCDRPATPHDASTDASSALDLRNASAPGVDCHSAAFQLDVRTNAHLAGLPADAFSLTLIDPTRDAGMVVPNSCFAEVSADAAVPYYAVCVDHLCADSDYILQVHVNTDAGTVSPALFFHTSLRCGDAGPGCAMDDVTVVDAALDATADAPVEAAADVVADTAIDAGIDDSATDASDVVTVDASSSDTVDGDAMTDTDASVPDA